VDLVLVPTQPVAVHEQTGSGPEIPAANRELSPRFRRVAWSTEPVGG
jgi:hypothetical protein